MNKTPIRGELAKLLRETRKRGEKNLAHQALMIGRYEANICRAINILVNKSVY